MHFNSMQKKQSLLDISKSESHSPKKAVKNAACVKAVQEVRIICAVSVTAAAAAACCIKPHVRARPSGVVYFTDESEPPRDADRWSLQEELQK